MTLPSNSKARKDTPIFSGVLRYFPDALAEVAKLSMVGNDKHNPGQPLHWSKGISTDHGDCLTRHQLEFDQIDPETITERYPEGLLHATHVAWRALAQLQTILEKRSHDDSVAKVMDQMRNITNTVTLQTAKSPFVSLIDAAGPWPDTRTVPQPVAAIYPPIDPSLFPPPPGQSGIGVSWSGNGTAGDFPATETI
jgi:hypothetical protein